MANDELETGDDLNRLFLNGIDAVTGGPVVDPMTLDQVVRLASTGQSREDLARSKSAIPPMRGLPDDIEPTDVTASGWAIVLPAGLPEPVQIAVERLVKHRRDHTGVPSDRCLVVEYQPDQQLTDWLRGLGAHLADVEPTRLPYYVTLVGDPETISYEFQVLLDMNYAVGRLTFDDADGFAQYVDSLIAYETAAAAPNSREVLYWGTRNRDDQATRLSAECLVRPLYEGAPATPDQPAMKAIAGERKFRSSCFLDAAATRTNLLERLCAQEQKNRPAFLFTASHGVGFPRSHERQRADQGALVCQEWPGRRTPPQPEHLLRAGDLHDDARVHGLVAFLFACYGAGTPAYDHFLQDWSQGPQSIADQSFVAALPQRLLSHPNGGALAVFGHVERAWAYSIRPPRLGARIRPFRNLLSRVLKGEPLGHATKDFSDRFTAAASQMNVMLDPSRPGPEVDPDELASLWIECNDARNFILLGDPAARLRTGVIS